MPAVMLCRPSVAPVPCKAIQKHCPRLRSQRQQHSMMDEHARYQQHLPLSTFVLEQLLSDDPQQKKVALLGRFEGSEGAVVLLVSRQHFQLKALQELLGAIKSTRLDFQNDIYGKYFGVPDSAHAEVTIDVIWPATEKHIRKHSTQQHHMVQETPEVYAAVVQPFIRSLPASRIQWVYNVLDKKAETERLVFEDPDPVQGFMLHPDLKWDQVQHEQLYLVALVHRRDIGSLRDLRAEHLPLLHSIRDKVAQVALQRYGVQSNQLRMFLHYQPSYYHLHVHVTHVSLEHAGLMAGKAHLLDDVIDNLQTFGDDYYKRKTLTYSIGSNEELWQLLSKHQAAAEPQHQQ